MAQQQPRPRSRSRSQSATGGAFHPDEEPPTKSDYNFCNAFWTNHNAVLRAEPGAFGGELVKEGYENLMGRMKMGTRTVEDLRTVFRERSAMEDDHAKKLSKLSKHPIGVGETGHMDRAITQLKSELDSASQAHGVLAAFLRAQDAQLAEFNTKREAQRKTQQAAVEKAWKNKASQETYVIKAKTKYEADAIAINTMNAQSALSQGKDLDRLSAKMDKTRQTVQVNQRDYENYVKVLKETTASWNMMWRSYCDLCQDQEEERLDFIKARLWDWTNAVSTVAMAEDEAAERTRTALEQCVPETDLQVFVSQLGTGHDIPDSPNFIDARVRGVETRPTFRTAAFPRSSTRGVKHNPSPVKSITSAFQSSPAPSPALERPLSDPPPAAAASSHPSFDAAPPSPTKIPTNLPTLDNALPAQSAPNLSQQATRPPLEPSSSSSRFTVSPSANPLARSGGDRSPAPSSSKPGHVSASAFQRRGPSNATSDVEAPAPPRIEVPASAAAPPAAPVEDEDEDPLVRALNKLTSSTSTTPLRKQRSSAGPMAGAVGLPGMMPQQQQQSRPLPTDRNSTGPPRTSQQPQQHHQQQQQQQQQRMSHRQSQQSLGRSAGDAYGRQPSSRPSSPGPSASLMQQPSQQSIPAVVGSYGQSFPGERASSRQSSNPSPSRQDSGASNRYLNGANLASPAPGDYPRSASPTPSPFAGVGARGASPGPQQFELPAGVRAPSPLPSQYRSTSPQPPSNYGGYPQQQQQQRMSQYGQPSPSQPNLARPASPLAFAPSHDRNGSSNGYRVDGRPGSQYGRASPAPQEAPQGYPQAPYQQPGYQVPGSASQQFQQAPQGYQQPSPASFHQPSPSPASYQQPSPAAPYRQPSPASSYQSAPTQHQTPSTLQQHYQQSPASSYQQQPHHPSQQASVVRTGSATSSAFGSYPAQSGQQGYVVQRAPSPAPAPASTSRPPPTGQYTEDGKSILFYVNAIYDYAAAGPEEFSFSQGDVIAVVETDSDGWWRGCMVGARDGDRIFPSNFTELLP